MTIGQKFWQTACLTAAAAALSIGAGCKKPAASGSASAAGRVKIGYVVKQPDEPWFQTEMAFAKKAGEDNGFDVVTLPAQDGEKALAAVDNLAAQGAKGFVICTPDVRLGPAIKTRADAVGMKVMSVDDQFVGPDGKLMTDIPHVGVEAREVGHVSGRAIAEQIKARGWDAKDVAALVVTFDELDTAHERTEGIIETLIESGFPKDKIYKSPQKTTDIPGSVDAANATLAQHGDVKKWVAAGMNDSAALGAVRALEGRGFTPDTAVAVGINGTDCIDELKKPQPTPFYGSVLMEANVHGRDSTLMMHKWATGGEMPKSLLTGGKLITRANFESELKQHGMWPK